MCFNLCPSFPELFQAIERHEGDVRLIAEAEIHRILDTCFQCKVCYVKCPYTPDDHHEFQLDFPRLMMRANAVRRRASGLELRSRLLSRPDLLGRMAGQCAGFANWANRQPLLRAGMEMTLGIHRDKLLPEFAAESFDEWFRNQPAPAGVTTIAVLFYTCSVNYNEPEVGKAAVEVYARSGVGFVCPKQNCCGMPALEAGNIDLARSLARQNVETLLPHVRAGRKVVAIDPTCSYMLRKEYGDLVGTAEAREVASQLHGSLRVPVHPEASRAASTAISAPRPAASPIICPAICARRTSATARATS